jgi:hypothetical protein
MTDNEILAMFAGSGEKVFTSEGWVPWDKNLHSKGAFRGKLGTPRRSRKGRTYRLGNGYATYDPWNPTEVIAYRS